MLHHLSEPAAALAEAQRILAPGGRLFVADFLRHNDETMRSRYGDRWLGFAQDALTEHLHNAGFVLTDSEQCPVGRHLQLVLLTAEARTA